MNKIQIAQDIVRALYNMKDRIPKLTDKRVIKISRWKKSDLLDRQETALKIISSWGKPPVREET